MLDKAEKMVELMLGNPAGPVQLYVLLGLGLALVFLLFDRISRATGAKAPEAARTLSVVVLGGVVLVGSMVFAQDHVLPRVGATYRTALLILAPFAGSLLITVPIMCLLQKTSYLSASISWLVSVMLTGVILILVRTSAEAVTTGKVSFNSTKQRTQEVQNFLDTQ
jgi:hypothetical protein